VKPVCFRRSGYTLTMQLRDARLCADCDEVHDLQQCPHCASERFSFLSRWVPLPEGRRRPQPTTSPQAEVYRELINPGSSAEGKNRSGSLFRSGVLSVAAVGMIGWLWRSATRARDTKDPATAIDRPPKQSRAGRD